MASETSDRTLNVARLKSAVVFVVNNDAVFNCAYHEGQAVTQTFSLIDNLGDI